MVDRDKERQRQRLKRQLARSKKDEDVAQKLKETLQVQDMKKQADQANLTAQQLFGNRKRKRGVAQELELPPNVRLPPGLNKAESKENRRAAMIIYIKTEPQDPALGPPAEPYVPPAVQDLAAEAKAAEATAQAQAAAAAAAAARAAGEDAGGPARPATAAAGTVLTRPTGPRRLRISLRDVACLFELNPRLAHPENVCTTILNSR